MFVAGMIGLTVSVILVCKKENVRQNLFLSICLFALSVSSIYGFYFSQGKTEDIPKIVLILKSLTYIIAPCAYLYIRNTMCLSYKLRRYDWLHFIPWTVNIIYSLINLSKPVDTYFWTSNNLFFNIDFYSFNVILNLLWLFYAYTQNIIMLNAKNNNEYKALNPGEANWFKGFSFLILLSFTCLLMQKIAASRDADFELLNNLIISVILILSGILVSLRPHIMFGAYGELEEDPGMSDIPLAQAEIEPDNLRKMPPVIIPGNKINEYVTIIENVLVKAQPFLKKGFVIRDLSDLTDIPVHHLSYIINTQYNLHFQDFVNQKRIDYLKTRIDDKEWQNLSLEGLAWAVGFKSRTTFFRAFLKLTGKSPSDFITEEKKKAKANYIATA